MFELSFKKIDQILHTDSGSATELDYVEQTSWILFLKYLDDLEETKKMEAALAGRKYRYILDKQYQWDTWAAPKTAEGKIDHQKALDGDDLKDFVNEKLFPYLRKFRSEEPDTIEYKIGEIFSELKNKISSGYKLREILNIVDSMHFQRYEEKHELSHLYEDKIKNMGNAGRNGGEYYTPRPLIRTIVEVVAPQIGEKIYDGACGSAGFLVEAYSYLTQNQAKLTSSQMSILQNKTLYGKEIKSLAYIIGIMNMILHGIEAPNIRHADTLAQNINDIQERDRYNVVLANPPFGAGIGREIQENFPIKTGETASLFLQHFIKILKTGGRAGIVIKNTFLSNGDAASISLRKMLLETCDLHTILDLPSGAFTGTTQKTVVLFFEKGRPTKHTWYYQLNLKRTLGRTNPLTEADLADFVQQQRNRADTQNSWTVDSANIDHRSYDLSVKNPNQKKEVVIRRPEKILKELKKLDLESEKILNSKLYLEKILVTPGENWEKKRVGDLCNLMTGGTPSRSRKEYFKDGEIKWLVSGDVNMKEIFDCEGRITEAGLENSNAKLLPINSVMIALNGQGKTRGTVAMLRTSATCNQSLVSIYPKNIKEILPEYIYHNLDLRYDEIRRITGDSGGDRRGLNMPLIRNIVIEYPKSIKEQRDLIKKFNKLSVETKRLEAISKQKISDLEELKRAVLEQAFAIPVPSPYIRNQVHAAIVQQVAKDDGSSTEVAIAKYDHLLQEVYGLSLGYKFETHQFGPFDHQIKRLISSGLGRNAWFSKRRGMVVYGGNVRSLLSRQSNIYRNAQTMMRQLSALGITKMDTDSVELLSTVCHSIKETQSIVLDEIRAFMSQWPTDNNRTKAEKFTEERTQKCLEFITKHGLERRLLAAT